MSTTTNATEMTEALAWEQVAAWRKDGCHDLWKKGEGILTLYLTVPKCDFPFEVSSVDKPDLRIIDCVQRMKRAMAAFQK